MSQLVYKKKKEERQDRDWLCGSEEKKWRAKREDENKRSGPVANFSFMWRKETSESGAARLLVSHWHALPTCGFVRSGSEASNLIKICSAKQQPRLDGAEQQAGDWSVLSNLPTFRLPPLAMR